MTALVEDQIHIGAIYAGTDRGVYASLDAGATWSSIGSGIAPAYIVDLRISKDSGLMLAATHGGGMYMTNLRLR